MHALVPLLYCLTIHVHWHQRSVPPLHPVVYRNKLLLRSLRAVSNLPGFLLGILIPFEPLTSRCPEREDRGG